MTQTLIYQKTKSHYDDGSQWIPSKAGIGIDTHAFSVPPGDHFARYSIDVEVASVGSGCTVDYAPDTGSGGDQVLRIRWWYNPLGKIKYILSAYAGEPEMVEVLHGENNWAGKAVGYVRQRQNLRLRGRGTVSRKLFSRMMSIVGKSMSKESQPTPAVTLNSVPRLVALSLLASMKYAAIGGIILFALDEGYTIKAHFDPKGALPFDDELAIEMTGNPLA